MTDIYSCQLLQSDHRTGTAAKIAIFTENGAIVMTSESCKSLIQEAIKQGSQTHIADQIGGIYVLRNITTTLATMSSSHVVAHSSHLDGLYTRYTRHGLSRLPVDLKLTDRTCLETVHSDGLISEDLDRRTSIACTPACNHPTHNNESQDILVLSRARLHTSYDSRFASIYRSIYAVTIRPKSLYEDVHASTGHPGYTGVQWHQKNTIGANYTDKDAAAP